MSEPVLVDVTSEETGDLLRTALGHGFNVAMANKKPVAGSWESYDALMQAAAKAGRVIKHEATVGAGLPIIDTYYKLAETGDKVLRIEGAVSGTLMYVVSAVSAGKPFSQAVQEAVDLGYAEPDPRDDLNGRDAGRKVLILARLMGYRGPAAEPEDLVPPSLRKLPLRRVHEAAAVGGCRLGRAREARGGQWARPALRRHRDADLGLGQARGGSRVEPARLAHRHAESRVVHDAPLPEGAAGRQRPGRRTGGDGGGHSERYLFAGKAIGRRLPVGCEVRGARCGVRGVTCGVRGQRLRRSSPSSLVTRLESAQHAHALRERLIVNVSGLRALLRRSRPICPEPFTALNTE